MDYYCSDYELFEKMAREYKPQTLAPDKIGLTVEGSSKIRKQGDNKNT